MATIKLTGAELFEITLIDSDNKYTKGKRAENNKTFSRYRYNTVVFAVDNDNPFVEDFTAGNVKMVKLIEGEREKEIVDNDGAVTVVVVPTITFDAHVNRKQYNSIQEDRMLDAKVESAIARYQHLATAPVTADMLEDLVNG